MHPSDGNGKNEQNGNTGDRPDTTAPESEPLELIQVTEAARRYPIGAKRLYGLIHAGEIPAIIIDNPVRKRIQLRPVMVEAWLRAQERRHTPSRAATR